MKLGISYNLFDGEELLEGSIKQIRSEVDYISVVYQTISNFGNNCSDELIPLLERLKNENLIDELFFFQPELESPPWINEINKRNIGLKLSIQNNCTHHMSMDSDEYYITEDFKKLKKDMIDGDYDSSICQIQTYYGQSNYVLDPRDKTCVSLIYKIRENIEFVSNFEFPAIVDPTRRMDPGKYKIYSTEELEMHHMSYIRKNIETKVNNSSSRVLFNDTIPRFVEYYKNWTPGKNALMPGQEEANRKLVEVEDVFKIKI